MTDEAEPTRLIRGDDAELSAVLESARRDGPSARALRAAPLAIGALLAAGTAEAAAAGVVGGAASAALPKTGGAAVALAAKWLAVGVVAGSLGSVATIELQHTVQPLPVPATSVRPAQSVRRPARAPRAETPNALPAAAESAPVAAPSAPPAPNGSVSRRAATERADLSREIALLDGATAALTAGDAQRALRLLDDADALRTRSLAPEATVVRVRALLRLGRRAEARGSVDRFVRIAPHAPQAAILRELVADTIP